MLVRLESVSALSSRLAFRQHGYHHQSSKIWGSALENPYTQLRQQGYHHHCSKICRSALEIPYSQHNSTQVGITHNISVGQALRKDVWGARWAGDDPRALAAAEKARLYVLRGAEPEEPLPVQGYLCRFQDLEITMALLDNITDKCTPQHVARVDVKSLRDTRQLLEQVGLREAEAFIKDNPHPRLW
ncbi:hypothetical protein JYU34_002596 [Plutella xylostella]|uniref:IFT121 second beta-propeller domain-containing protein n=1 Tax=Plutella xylostella TaxID=51655 RepID=A0ABQ7R2T4_PLUXY|nr:hypothetical protein JYU34_002596 [Plutella xylostella]